MIDLNALERYRENNRIEAKKALGGLPHSIWETYSAFANTFGGLILLGVEEHKDKSLHTVDLPAPELLVHEFWELVNDPRTASVNILSAGDVAIHEVNGDRIIVITVPRADRCDKPVYVEGNPVSGTYRRSGEGDYRCSREEVQAMYRDAARRSQDMLIVDALPLSDLDPGSLARFRGCVERARPGHRLGTLSDEAFLLELDAAALGADGAAHPTAAGLLMFGAAEDITRVFPRFRLDYSEEDGDGKRVFSLGGEADGWRGNVFEFFFRVSERLFAGLSPAAPGGESDDPLRLALREALINCLVNADYYGRGGISVRDRPERISFTNPGVFRIPVAAAKDGGVSDPRNAVLHRLFNLTDAGEHGGSGIPMLCSLWRAQGWSEPIFTQRLDPDRTILTLPLTGGEAAPVQGGKARSTIRGVAVKDKVIQFLTDRASADAGEIARLTGLSRRAVSELTDGLIAEGLISEWETEGERRFRLKA